MGKTQEKTQAKAVKAETTTVQDLFLLYVKKAGYSLKAYNQLAEKSVQLNGKIKLYYVPLKGGNLKLCLQNINIPKVDFKGVQVLQQNTYPAKYTQRVYFKGCNASEVSDFLDNLLQQALPVVTKA